MKFCHVLMRKKTESQWKLTTVKSSQTSKPTWRIVTKTHELYLEETPEKFEVRAYDEFGNEFSTLRGIKFRWTIESGGGTAKGTDILRFMTWKDSPYNTEPILEKLESEGFQGNKVLLEGIKTGSAKVSVKLVDSQYSSVAPAVEPLMVVANLFLVPAAAFLLPCASLEYSANQIKSNKMVPVPLPSPNHNLIMEPQLGQLEAATVTAGTELNRGLVELMDKNVAPGELVTPPQADLSVVTPASLELRCGHSVLEAACLRLLATEPRERLHTLSVELVVENNGHKFIREMRTIVENSPSLTKLGLDTKISSN